MFCPQCGVEAIRGARFCTACGGALPLDQGRLDDAGERPPDTLPTHGSAVPATEAGTVADGKAEMGKSDPLVIPFPARSAEHESDQNEGDQAIGATEDLQARAVGEPVKERPFRFTAVTWLVTLSVALTLALGIGAALALTELSRRDQTIRAYQRQVAALTEANVAYQDQLGALVGERDRLAQERSALGRERDSLLAERDRLNATIEDLETTVAEYQKQVADLNARLGEQERQLSQAREEASRQQTRAEEAEAFGLVMAQVVALDDEIHREFANLLDAIGDMERAYDWNDGPGFFSAYDRALQTAARLDQLFAERERLLSQFTD